MCECWLRLEHVVWMLSVCVWEDGFVVLVRAYLGFSFILCS